MINAQKTDINDIKTKINEYLFENGIVFSSKENINEYGETYYIYLLESGKIGIITLLNGKFNGIASDNGKINWAEKEGFSEQEIDEDHPIWIHCLTIEKFLENFAPVEKV